MGDRRKIFEEVELGSTWISGSTSLIHQFPYIIYSYNYFLNQEVELVPLLFKSIQEKKRKKGGWFSPPYFLF